ncbi:glycerophosphoryl diester phosphodiesterase [Pilibacter termitis]|uniref:Glycerophosphoryl diester phosphodiesterase n=1 Tax=Pilibacter termitis TaxID=263852 RepID=A0A1T4M6K7_9ENTE|nr:glycerophosphodiester phosphodiesterase [Pilibacter termitis]SJZ62535.1 glycerophosphoryl diester phosphodiesterase [Pilibacter termitis]
MQYYFKRIGRNTLDFFKGTKGYLRDVLLLHFVMIFLISPILVHLARGIMKVGNVEILSYDNLGVIAREHFWVLVGLILTVVLMLLLIYFEFTFFTISMYFIQKKQSISLHQLLRITLAQMLRIRFGIGIFFLFYFFLILPFGVLAGHLDILSSIKIPAFIMDFIFANRLMIVLSWGLFYLFCSYLGLRFIFVLPLLTLREISLQMAIQESWCLTRRKFLRLLGQILLIELVIVLSYALFNTIIFTLQQQIEHFLPTFALNYAVFNMLLLQIASILNLTLSTFFIYFVTIRHLEYENELPDVPKWFKIEEGVATAKAIKFEFLVILSVTVGVIVYFLHYNLNYLKENELSTPLIYSHRGVSGNNGVQNTLSSLEKTAKLHPDYIEMDIQETKDKQFVVMHDENLENLTGIKASVGELTLQELSELTVSENGFTSPLATFDDYLKKAQALNQKLLIEIKVYGEVSGEVAENFLKKYKKDIKKYKHRVHSLSFQIVSTIKAKDAEIYCSYIIPFNIVGPPTTNTNAYTMEYSTLNSSFVDVSHREKKQVLAWTVNDENSVERVRSYGVNGIITDDVEMLQRVLKESKKEIPYSKKLAIYALGLDVTQ